MFAMLRGRLVRLAALLLAAASVAWMAPAARADGPACLQRVRAADRTIAGMMDDASRRSPTLRRLVSDLHSSDVIVYVGICPHLPAGDLGGLQFVCARGRHRYLRVSVRPRLGPREFLATLAHELQHAAEVAAHRRVTDASSMAALYELIGRPSRNGYETEAAIRISHQVCAEFDATVPVESSTR